MKVMFNQRLIISILTFCGLLPGSVFAAHAIEGQIIRLDPKSRSVQLKLLEVGDSDFKQGTEHEFRFSRSDAEIGYQGRRIRANANDYNNVWHLEQVFPIDGPNAETAAKVNHALRQSTVKMRRGRFIKKGDAIPNFGMIDQNGDFMQIKDLRGKAFVLNFIFTRCAAPKMCPASSTKMEQLQEQAKAAGLTNLHFVSITLDPAFDSPGVFRTYAKAYGFELENFHLLTAKKQVVDDLLRQFGILTIDEDGTINHTMATLLVDADGRVAYRKEGPSWRVKDFLKAAKKL